MIRSAHQMTEEQRDATDVERVILHLGGDSDDAVRSALGVASPELAAVARLEMERRARLDG